MCVCGFYFDRSYFAPLSMWAQEIEYLRKFSYPRPCHNPTLEGCILQQSYRRIIFSRIALCDGNGCRIVFTGIYAVILKILVKFGTHFLEKFKVWRICHEVNTNSTGYQDFFYIFFYFKAAKSRLYIYISLPKKKTIKHDYFELLST